MQPLKAVCGQWMKPALDCTCMASVMPICMGELVRVGAVGGGSVSYFSQVRLM